MQIARFHLKKSMIPLLIVGTAAVVFMLLIFIKPRIDAQPPVEKAWKVSTMRLEQKNTSPQVILQGTTESPNYTILEAAVTADVIATPVDEGDVVEKDSLLLELDDREAVFSLRQRSADVDELKAKIEAENDRYETDKIAFIEEESIVDYSEKELNRQRYLRERDLGAQFAVDEAGRRLAQNRVSLANRELAIEDHENRLHQLEAQLQRAMALQDQAELDLQRTTLLAPFNARVVKRNVATGNRAQAGESLMEIYDINTIEIRAQIPSRYLSTIRQALNQKQPLLGTAMLDGDTFYLILDRLASQVDQRRGGLDGLFSLTDEHYPIALERTVEITLNLPKKTGYKIPITALYGNDIVYRVNPNTSRLEKVVVDVMGYLYDQAIRTEVLIASNELHDNDCIITSPLLNARDNLLVDVVNEQGTSTCTD